MAIIRDLNGKSPEIGKNTFLAETAAVIGDVKMGEDCSIWYSAVLRGDVNYIKMGNLVNVQDGACIHGTYEKSATDIGDNVSIGHNATVHGCKIEDNVLIGMGAVIMDDAVVKKNTIVAAGAVVLQGTVCEEGSIYAGVPAKKVKTLTEKELDIPLKNAEHYLIYKGWYQN